VLDDSLKSRESFNGNVAVSVKGTQERENNNFGFLVEANKISRKNGKNLFLTIGFSWSV
jgi:hypothetical protein